MALLSLHSFLIMENSLECGREVTKLILQNQNRILKNELVAKLPSNSMVLFWKGLLAVGLYIQ